jgi:RNA polymerase sigma-54 factor
MSQILSQSLSQQMRMEQRLTPQLIQSMAILQKPVTDLEAYIQEALESNPALEQVEPEPDEKPTSGDGRGEQGGDGRTEAQSFQRLERLSRFYDLDGNEAAPFRRRAAADTGERDAKIDAMANTAGREKSLNEHLLDQWALVEAEPRIAEAGELIINHIDPDGYLRVRLEEVGESVRPAIDVEMLERALAEVRKLEPRGIGARDVMECLLLQLDALPGDNRIERTLIKHHLDDITHNRLPAVAKATGYSLGEIGEAIKAMRATLNLHPGYLVGDRSLPRIRPDVLVDYAETGGGLTVRLARGNAPKLRVSDELVKLARTKSPNKETRDFARKHVEEAAALIDAVNFRRNRLLDVAGSIVQKQREFFEVGPEGLQVCRMSDLATELECDPSTISRTVADKYLQCPRGIYPLRYFFTGGTETGDGKTTSWDSVKIRVKDLIEAEDRKSPYSDEQVASLLKKEGIEISRRTVAKYRQQLSIPSARQRREF